MVATTWVVAFLAGCGGADGVGPEGTQPIATPDPTPDPETTDFTCDPSLAPSPTPMRRLSHDQYARTVDAAIELLGGSALDDAVGASVRSLVDRVPTDLAENTQLTREDQTVTQLHAEQWYLVAEALADGVVDHHTIDCDDSACVDGLVTSVGTRLLRRPVGADEHSFYVDEVYASAPDHIIGIRDLILVWLASPSFVHQLEHGQEGEHGDIVPLTAYELANRLAYHAWNAPPDDELWMLAADGTLLDDAVYAAQVDRVFADARSQVPREQFFSDWLQLNDVPELHGQVGMPGFDAFRGDVTPGPDLHERVQRDTLDLIQWHIANGSDLDAVLTDPVHTVMDPEVGALYGVAELWDGVSQPDALTTGHGGLLTRPAFHVTGTTDTRPIHKGVVIRRRVLCDVLGDPPADLGPEPEIDETATARVRTEQLTEIDGSVCLSCHSVINGLGYVSEGFDGLGRVRREETVYADDGSVLAVHPIDDAAAAQVEYGDLTTVRGADALAQALADSPKVDACMSRFWFRHTWGRAEDEAVDGCVLQDVEQRLTSGESLASALRASALDDGFKVRRLDEETETDGGAR